MFTVLFLTVKIFRSGVKHETAMRYLERHGNIKNRSLSLSKCSCSKRTAFQTVFLTRSNTLFIFKNEQISFRVEALIFRYTFTV